MNRKMHCRPDVIWILRIRQDDTMVSVATNIRIRTCAGTFATYRARVDAIRFMVVAFPVALKAAAKSPIVGMAPPCCLYSAAN